MKKSLLSCIAIVGMHSAFAQLPNYHWNNSISGGSSGTGIAVVADPLGNVYTVGRCGGTSDFDPSIGIFNLTGFGGEDIFVVKVDAQGNFLWAKNFGGSGQDLPTSIALSPERELVVVGHFEGTADFDPSAGTTNLVSNGGDDGFIFKLSEAGNLVWAKSYASAGNVKANDVSVDGSGNIYVTGDFYETLDLDPGAASMNVTASGNSDVFVSKLNGSGAYLDGVRIGGTSVERSNGLSHGTDGGVYVTGVFTSNVDFDPGAGLVELTGSFDVFVLKLTTGLDFSWVKSFGTVGVQEGFEVETDGFGVYIAGLFVGTVDFDPNAGVVEIASLGSDDVFLVKLTTDGVFQYVRTFGSTGTEDYLDLCVSENGNIYLTGDLGGNMDADPTGGTYMLTKIGAEDIYHIGLNANGELSWAMNYGVASTFMRGRGIYADGGENVYSTGQYAGTIDFNPGAGVNNFTSTDNMEIYTQKLGPGFNTINEGNADFLQLYPNPSNGKFTIYTPSFSEEKSIRIYDVSGKLVAADKRSGYQNEFDCSGLNAGHYFIQVSVNDQTQIVKFSKN